MMSELPTETVCDQAAKVNNANAKLRGAIAIKQQKLDTHENNNNDAQKEQQHNMHNNKTLEEGDDKVEENDDDANQNYIAKNADDDKKFSIAMRKVNPTWKVLYCLNLIILIFISKEVRLLPI